MTVTATPEVITRGAALSFIGHGDGGPTVIVPNAVLAKYWGVFDEHGGDPGLENTHYNTVCDAELLMPFEGHELLVLQEEGSTAWVPDGDGGLLLRWVGADSGAALLAAVQGQSFTPAGRNGTDAVWTIPDGGLTFMHAVEDGRRPIAQRMWDSTAIELPPGRYAVEQLACGEWRGTVAFPDGHVEEVMMMCYRLRRAA